MNDQVDPIDIRKLETAMEKTQNRNTTRLDGMYGGLLKHCFLHYLNMCWQCCIPAEWNMVKVIPLFIKGNRNGISNYRDISSLNVGYKIYTRILNQLLQAILDAILLVAQ